MLFAGDAAALTGLAALETVADLAVFLTEGKTQSYLARKRAVSFTAYENRATDWHGSYGPEKGRYQSVSGRNSDPCSSVQIRG